MEGSPPATETTGGTPDVPSSTETGRTAVDLSSQQQPIEFQERSRARKSIAPYSGFNPDLAGTPSTPPGTDRFIFVNVFEPSAPGQRQRVDQKTINAHVQTTAYRQRRSAAVERLNRNIMANVGRFRPRVPLAAESNRPYSQNSTQAAAASVPAASSPGRHLSARRRQGSMRNLDVGPINTMISVTEEGRDPEDEDDACGEMRAMRVVLQSISRRMASLEQSQMLHGNPQSLLDPADADPFTIASVPITKGMNKVFSHCMSMSFTRTNYFQKDKRRSRGK
jgi:hypothetical protein